MIRKYCCPSCGRPDDVKVVRQEQNHIFYYCDYCQRNFDCEPRKRWPLYYDVPTQVEFQYQEDEEEISRLGGIAYEDVIICGECGSTIPLDDESLIDVKPLSWITVSETILGDD